MTKLAIGEIETLESEETSGKDQTTPTFGDDDGGDDLEVDFYPDSEKTCTWSSDPDEHRRAFVFFHLSSPDIDGKILVKNMELVCQWLKTGATPDEQKVSPRLSAGRISPKSG